MIYATDKFKMFNKYKFIHVAITITNSAKIMKLMISKMPVTPMGASWYSFKHGDTALVWCFGI